MRFHWGLGVGHVYAHRSPCQNPSVYKKWPSNPGSQGDRDVANDSNYATNPDQAGEEEGSASEGEENGGEDLERQSVKSQDSDEEGESDSEHEEELVFYDMYGFVDSDGDDD